MDFAARTTAARRRGLIAAAILALAIAPAIPLLIAALRGSSDYSLWSDVFIKALLASLSLATGVAVVSLGLGLPLGLLAALYGPRRRPILLVAQALPLLLPSFLLAIGWRHLPAVGLPKGLFPPSGFGGAALVMGLQAAPLPLLATWAACRNLTASQIDAARLHGGERIVLTRAAMACAPVAIVAALLAGILSLSDPGAAQVFRCPSAAMEIRTSFAALGDRVLAARQCLVMAGLALLLTAPVLLVGLPHLAAAVLARQTRPVVPYRHRLLGGAGQAGLVALLLVAVGLPALGLCLPAIERPMFARAAKTVLDTAPATLAYTLGAAAVAVSLATVLALLTMHSLRLRLAVLAALMVLLALPPALGAIGVVHAATVAPPWLDWLTRSRLTVAVVLGLRLLPVAAVAMMRAVGSLSPSWSDAASLCGVPKRRFLYRVTIPVLMPTILIGLLLVAVLAAADVTTTQLLYPPGRASLPLAVLTIMANSPEGLVASLSLLYLLGVVLLMLVATMLSAWLLRKWKTS
ncbi:MAG: ABC transporter permease subunit [Planctomycetes bacterium]|nr:ABC transporter permease subunit [Planctomycetota bacterium]